MHSSVMVVGVSSFRILGSKTDDEALRRDDERRTDTLTVESLPRQEGQTSHFGGNRNLSILFLPPGRS
jgi:hypothetical protein